MHRAPFSFGTERSPEAGGPPYPSESLQDALLSGGTPMVAGPQRDTDGGSDLGFGTMELAIYEL